MQVKIVLFGNSESGKTSLITRYVDKNFSRRPQKTIGGNFYHKKINIGPTAMNFQLWDVETATNPILGPSFYRETHAAVLVIDSTQPFNHNEIQTQINQIKQLAPDAKIYIAVNKCDDRDSPIHKDFQLNDFKNDPTGQVDQVGVTKKLKTATQGLISLQDKNIFFCSAKDDKNVHELFYAIGENHVEAHQVKDSKTPQPLLGTTKPKDNPKSILLKRLGEYTAWWKWAIAYIKDFFGFGLSLKKLGQATKLKNALSNNEEDGSRPRPLANIIEDYEKENQNMVTCEYNDSSYFDGMYIFKVEGEHNQTYEGLELANDNTPYFRTTAKTLNINYERGTTKFQYINLDKGEFGKILLEAKSPRFGNS